MTQSMTINITSLTQELDNLRHAGAQVLFIYPAHTVSGVTQTVTVLYLPAPPDDGL